MQVLVSIYQAPGINIPGRYFLTLSKSEKTDTLLRKTKLGQGSRFAAGRWTATTEYEIQLLPVLQALLYPAGGRAGGRVGGWAVLHVRDKF